jgi:uncharacterized protein with NAD-binding domain and iron-sulfur cluster
VSRAHGRVAILGGGMAGLSAAWRLSEPGWRDRFESITVYQRGWRLGGKAASSRGPNDRIEEHGLHVWLGSYENAFALLREAYTELDRESTDPGAPIKTWREALIPANSVGLAEQWGDDWLVWLSKFSPNDDLPGDPDRTGREFTAVAWIPRALNVICDFIDSLQDTEPIGLVLSESPQPPRQSSFVDTVRRGVVTAMVALTDPQPTSASPADVLGHILDTVRSALDYEHRPDHKRTWLLISLVTATVRGMLADRTITDPRGFARINEEDVGDWLLRHGAHPDVRDFPLVRGLYNLVFGYRDGDPQRPALAAGVACLLASISLFQYSGALFWKMTAGMGDVVIAPIYEALRRRGVDFEFFHRLDALHLDDRRQAIAAITLGRQVRLAAGVDRYEPLIRVQGLPVFPDRPLADQIQTRAGIDTSESHFGCRDDAETRVLRRGVDFDHVVLAVSIGMVEIVAGELIADRPEWREMTQHVSTVATQAFQVWLRTGEHELGWTETGVTTSAYIPPFHTWASMPQTLWAESWPDYERAQAVSYFCGELAAEWPTARDHVEYVRDCEERVLAGAATHLDRYMGLYLPGAVTDDGFAWHLLVGADGQRGSEALASQHISVNVDPSDRYVQSLPGTDRYRLRPDESGYDNLVLAGDWTDSGLNAGCIEAAVLSGLQAANALLGRGRRYRIRGFYLP